MADLPEALRARLDAAFRDAPLVTEAEAARIIGFSPASLRRERKAGNIGFRLRGKRRVYAREDLEAYFRRDAACPSTDPKTATAASNRRTTTSISRSRSTANVVAFTGRQGSELLEQLKRSKRRNASARSAPGRTTTSP
nr:helix-turn-helix domain-containing protein [Jiella sp. LLJ827]